MVQCTPRVTRASDRSLEILGRLWRRVPAPIRRRALFATNHHFLAGVVGLIRDDQHRILLLDHRFRTPYRWGLPGGFIHHGETWSEALQRELQEEIGLEVEPDRLIDTELNRQGRYISVTLLAHPVGSPPDLDRVRHPEVTGGGFFAATELPAATYPRHRALIERLARNAD